MASTDSRPVPIKNTAYRVVFPILDADGDLVTGAAGLDSEVSKDQGTFADCTNEATEIATNSGMYYLDLTSTEMNADCVSIIVKTSTTGAKTTPLVLYPQETGDIKVDVESFGGTAGTFASGIPSTSLTTAAINAVADQVWDENVSGHHTVASYGQALNVIRAGTAQAGSSTTITLDSGASAVDDFYNNQIIHIDGGTGANQSRIITDYVGSTKVATVSSWATNPSSDTTFIIKPFGSIPGATAPTAGEVADAVWDEATSGHTAAGSYGQAAGGVVLHTGTAQAGSTSSITLASGASSTDDRYNRNLLAIIGGTGAGQSSQITDYVGSTKVATLSPALAVAPDNTSVYLMLPLGIDAATVAAVADAVWDEQRADHVSAGSFGERVTADTTAIAGSTAAGTNAKSFFDGTGYAGTNNVIPSVTTVTGNVNGNVGGNVTGNVGGNVTGSIGSLAAQAKADVNAEVVDTLNVDTYAEPGQENPGATISLAKKIGYLYKAWRNRRTQTASDYKLFNDDATTVDQKATFSDNGSTAERTEVGTGP